MLNPREVPTSLNDDRKPIRLTPAARRGGPVLHGGEEGRSPESAPWP